MAISSLLACEGAVAQLDILVEGRGTTNPSPGRHHYTAGTTVRVAAVPASGETFLG